MKTVGVKYLGSKRKLIPYIVEATNKLDIKEKTAIDVFTGTTRVAQAYKKLGFKVVTSDLAWASEVYSNALVCNDGDIGHLLPIIEELNKISPKSGWITENYCDVSSKVDSNFNIKVWTPENGKKADAARDYIEGLSLKKWEKDYLTCSVIFALNKTDNTVGIQQAYLKKWCTRATKPIVFEPLPAIKGPCGQHITGDALEIDYPECELAYIDPPYTAATYYSHYHIWDSVAKWDKPEVSLKTNRRLDRKTKSKDFDKSMHSPWYSKKTALEATSKLIDRLPVRYCILSYSNEGLISYKDMISICNKYSYEEINISHKKNIMHKIGSGYENVDKDAPSVLTEYLFIIKK